MAKKEIVLPAMGEGITDATITRWLVKEGDKVEEDDSIVEVATDKVDSEIPSPCDGVVDRLLFNEGDTPSVGDIIAIINTGVGDDEPETVEDKTEDKPVVEKDDSVVVESSVDDDEFSGLIKSRTPSGRFLSPLVRSIAKKEDISIAELERVEGTGDKQRITRDDLLRYIENRGKSGPKVVNSKVDMVSDSVQKEKVSAPVVSEQVHSGNVEIIEMDRMRKLIGEHMVMSKRVSPHVTSFVEVDVTNMVMWRNKVKDSFLKREGEKLTFMPLFIEATTRAIKDYPLVNSSVDGDKIIRKKDINIGMATALPNGNLIVPVIKNSDKKSIVGLAADVNSLADRARNNSLKPDEIQGGTFTITNMGSFGNITGTPIINQPQVAILAIGAIVKKPAVIETPQGDTIGIRHMMILSLSYDHRIVDGALGGMFLKQVGDYIQNWDTERGI
jgi:2-oxoglutarate dehydrogenase E2 component (dihydrolipoamide succinyltransferase)